MPVETRGPLTPTDTRGVDGMLGDRVEPGWYAIELWRRRTWLLVAAVLCAAGAAVTSVLAPRVYEAQTTLAVVSSKIAETQGGSSSTTSDFRPLIENNTVAETVVREFSLGGPPHHYTTADFLGEALSVQEVRNSTVMRVSVRLQDPQVAAKAANRIAALAVEGAKRTSRNEAVVARDDIEVEVRDARKRLDEALAALEQYQQKAQVELLKAEVDSLVDERGMLVDLDSRIAEARGRVARAEQDLSSRTRVDVLTRSIDKDPALVEAARQQPRPDGVLGLQLKTEEINKVYEGLERDLVEARADLAALERRRMHLVGDLGLDRRSQAKLTELYRHEAEISRLKTELEVAQKSYETIAEHYDVARLRVAGRSAQLVIVDPAVVPARPDPRRAVRSALFAALAGLALAAVCVILLTWARSLRDEAAQR
jgi:uncharacterized protein involved in exopolysaccharide biosynthesis